MKYFAKLAKPKTILPEGNSQGIPDRESLSRYPEVSEPITVPAVLHKHEAKRAGFHYDLRLVDPNTGKAHS